MSRAFHSRGLHCFHSVPTTAAASSSVKQQRPHDALLRDAATTLTFEALPIGAAACVYTDSGGDTTSTTTTSAELLRE